MGSPPDDWEGAQPRRANHLRSDQWPAECGPRPPSSTTGARWALLQSDKFLLCKRVETRTLEPTKARDPRTTFQEVALLKVVMGPLGVSLIRWRLCSFPSVEYKPSHCLRPHAVFPPLMRAPGVSASRGPRTVGPPLASYEVPLKLLQEVRTRAGLQG